MSEFPFLANIMVDVYFLVMAALVVITLLVVGFCAGRVSLRSQLKVQEVEFQGQLSLKDQQLDQAEQLYEELNEKERDHWEQKLKLLEDNKVQLTQAFENLANKIFHEKQKHFTEQSKQGLDAVLTPFKDQLTGFRQKIEEMQLGDAKERASLKTQLDTLYTLNQRITDEASNLTKALKGDKKLQGNWGEIQLEMILDQSGLKKGREFEREANFKDDESSNKRPDFIIHLPESKHIIIDSKVSLVDYLRFVEAETDEERDKALKSHVLSIRNHIKGLSKKGYSKLVGVNSPDFVFMFLPIEPAFIAAFDYDEGLFNDAFESRIVVVTPTTLLATLRTVANLWSIERQNQSARKLADQAGKVYDKLRVFVEKMEKLGIQMNTANVTYHDAWNTLREGQGNLVSQAHKFLDLGVRVKKTLPKSVVASEDSDDVETGVVESVADRNMEAT